MPSGSDLVVTTGTCIIHHSRARSWVHALVASTSDNRCDSSRAEGGRLAGAFARQDRNRSAGNTPAMKKTDAYSAARTRRRAAESATRSIRESRRDPSSDRVARVGRHESDALVHADVPNSILMNRIRESSTNHPRRRPAMFRPRRGAAGSKPEETRHQRVFDIDVARGFQPRDAALNGPRYTHLETAIVTLAAKKK